MRTEVGVERKWQDSRYIHLRKKPQEQVTDRKWAEPVVELPWEENVEGQWRRELQGGCPPTQELESSVSCLMSISSGQSQMWDWS